MRINIIITLWMTLFCNAFAAEPNTLSNDPNWKVFMDHWLDVKSFSAEQFDPNVKEKHTFTMWPCNGDKDNYVVVRPTDPNQTLEIIRFHRNRFNYQDFVIFAKRYSGDPNYVPEEEISVLSGYVMCYSDSTKLSHDPNCPYVLPRRTEPIPASELAEYEPCPICRPDIIEMLKGVTDPNLIPIIKELMK